jgi:multiple sugar transport system permease protein
LLKYILTVLFLALGITMLFPLLWMISTSFKVEADVFEFPVKLIPSRSNGFDNYRQVWGKGYNFALYYWNSIKIAVASTVLQVFLSSLGAYGFSKIKWKWRDRIFMLYLATMMIPSQVTLISRFLILREIHLYNTHLGLIIMASFSVYGVFLLRQNMMQIPESLSESARIDGANHWQIYSGIIMPLVKPAVATLAILKFVWTWNDYQNPLVFLNTRELFTIPLGIKEFASETGTFYSLNMAAAVCAIIPLIIVFLFGQRYIVDGITSGAVKE